MTEDESASFPLAKVTDRFLAYIIDIVPFAVGYYVSLWLLIVRLARLPNTPGVWRNAFVAWLALYLLYQALGNVSGGTLGKRLFGLRVVRLNGTAPGFVRCAVRALGYILSTPLMNLGFLWSLFNADSRTWHDLIAGTIVVEIRPKSPAAAFLSALLSFAVIAAVFGSNIWFVLRPTPFDEEALRKAEDGLKVLGAIQETYKARHGTYTRSLADLARTSGDVGEFQSAMKKIFDDKGFVIVATKESYVIRARARDRRRTLVEISVQ